MTRRNDPIVDHHIVGVVPHTNIHKTGRHKKYDFQGGT